MNINWKLRFKNTATITALAAAIVAFVYQILGIIGVTAPISQDNIMQAVGLIINLLVAMGILVDPTTPGVSDSAVSQAKTNINQTAESIVKSQQDDMAEAIDATESEVRK